MAHTIKVGTKLRKADGTGYVLEVIELFTPDDGPPHARTRVKLRRHDLGERLYSVSALSDPKLFVPITD